MSLWTCTRPTERNFSFEVSVLHDFTPLVVPWTHSEETRRNFQFFFGKALMSSDAAIAVSHNTKADAGWLCDMPQERVVVAHSGPTICVEKHLHDAPVKRQPECGHGGLDARAEKERLLLAGVVPVDRHAAGRNGAVVGWSDGLADVAQGVEGLREAEGAAHPVPGRGFGSQAVRAVPARGVVGLSFAV